MAREPVYPEDASIGGKAAPAPKPTTPAPEAAPAKPIPAAKEGRSTDPRRNKHLMAGAAIGIGSAAIVAALLYANRNRRTDKS